MKRFSPLGLAALLCLFLSACGSAPAAKQQSNGAEPVQETSQQHETASSKEAGSSQQLQSWQEKAKVAVYYADSNAMELMKEEQEITYQDDADKYRKAMELLGRPAKKGHEALWANFTYHSIRFDKGQLTIDASGKNRYSFGSSAEGLAFEALKKTMFQFPEVKKIVILQDGKAVESLMGHVDTSEPLTR